MQVEALDHINIITPDIDASCAFYSSLLGLQRRNAPPPLTPTNAQWMYDHADRAILHINSLDCPRTYERDVVAGPTGSIHHVALRCHGFAEMIDRLDARGADYKLNRVDAINLDQIFTEDPNGILLELNFFGG